jgi:hypothetical protein
MLYSNLPIGSKFTFKFDSETGWAYEKLTDNKVVVIQAPKTELRYIGTEYPIENTDMCQTSETILLKEEEKS